MQSSETVCAFLVELRGHHEEHFCEIILNMDQCMVQKEILLKDISYVELRWTFCSAERKASCHFDRGHHDSRRIFL